MISSDANVELMDACRARYKSANVSVLLIEMDSMKLLEQKTVLHIEQKTLAQDDFHTNCVYYHGPHKYKKYRADPRSRKKPLIKFAFGGICVLNEVT